MLLNTSGQTVGAQMVSASDGSAFTGSVTVSVTVDAGTQATGSVGSGACTHEGNGYHTYAPAQAETNGALLAFTFTGTGAIPTTVQVYTRSGDTFARLGAPAGASIAADLADIEGKVDDLESRLGTPGDFGSGTSTIAANLQDLADNGTAAFDRSTDSLQAIRDRGDAAWITATGFATSTELAKVPKSDSNVTWNATAAAQMQTKATDALNAYDPPTRAELTSDKDEIIAETDALALLIAALDADLTDAQSEPTGVPAANASVIAKVAYLFMAWRNRVDVTATKKTFYGDDGAAEFEKDLSDDDTTYSESEVNSV